MACWVLGEILCPVYLYICTFVYSLLTIQLKPENLLTLHFYGIQNDAWMVGNLNEQET